MTAVFLNFCMEPSILTADSFKGVLFSAPTSIRSLRIPNSHGSFIPNSIGFSKKWRIMAENDVLGEEKTISDEGKTQEESVSKDLSGKGFGPPKSSASASAKKAVSNGKDSKERKSSSPIIRRTPLEKPFAVPQGDPKIEQNEIAFLLSMASLGIVIFVEGIALAASGFLPQEWDNFLVKYLYPSFTPTVVLFLVGAAGYGLYKYLGGGSQNS